MICSTVCDIRRNCGKERHVTEMLSTSAAAQPGRLGDPEMDLRADPRLKPRLPDAANVLAVSTRTVRRYIAGGQLEAVRLGRKTLRVKVDSMERFIDRPADRHLATRVRLTSTCIRGAPCSAPAPRRERGRSSEEQRLQPRVSGLARPRQNCPPGVPRLFL